MLDGTNDGLNAYGMANLIKSNSREGHSRPFPGHNQGRATEMLLKNQIQEGKFRRLSLTACLSPNTQRPIFAMKWAIPYLNFLICMVLREC